MYKVGQLFTNDCGWRLIPGLWSVLPRLSSLFPLTTEVFTEEQGKPGATFPQGKAEPVAATWLSN